MGVLAACTGASVHGSGSGSGSTGPATSAAGTGQPSLPAATGTDGHAAWIVGYSVLNRLRQLSPTLAEKAFRNDGTIVIVSSGAAGGGAVPAGLAALPTDWGLVPVMRFTSYADMSAAFAAGKIPAAVKGVGYDNEASGPTAQFTPAAELAGTARFDQLAAALVHQHHLMYLQLGNAGGVSAGAAGADIYDLQLQTGEGDVARFVSRVEQAVATIHSANPNARVYVGLTTAQGHTAAQMEAAARAVIGRVAGFWINVPSPGVGTPNAGVANPAAAVDFLHSWLG